jgi:hypothetical protein
MKTAALITLLQSTPAVSSLLSTAVNVPAPKPAAVYKQVLPRGYTLPAIVVHRYNGAREQDMSGPVDIREDNFQLDVYGDTDGDCDAATDAARSFLTGFTGTLADGTVVTGTYLEQDRDMPFLPNADVKSLAFRSLLGYRFVTKV